MNDNNMIFIGLDTHKDFNEVAYCEDERLSKPIHQGRIPNTKQAVTKLIRQLQSKYPHPTLHFVYEAGPCGYWLYRFITSLGHSCYILAPSLIPKKSGDKIKTDKRDALKLCQLLKNNDIDPIYVPEPDDEAVRDLSRARETAMKDLKDGKYQLKALLLRNNVSYSGTANWTVQHLHWLAQLILPHTCQQIVLQEMINTINERINRLQRLDNELLYQARSWRYYPVVQALQAMRGIKLTVAVGTIAELGDLKRFDHPSKLMAYLGLVPSEHTTSNHRRQGSITKCGNGRARRLLTEAAHTYKHAAKVSTEMCKRQEGLPQEVIDIAWQAQLRLCRRYQRLMQRGKVRNVVIIAIARELAGFIWAIARAVVLEPVNPKLRTSRITTAK